MSIRKQPADGEGRLGLQIKMQWVYIKVNFYTAFIRAGNLLEHAWSRSSNWWNDVESFLLLSGLLALPPQW